MFCVGGISAAAVEGNVAAVREALAAGGDVHFRNQVRAQSLPPIRRRVPRH